MISLICTGNYIVCLLYVSVLQHNHGSRQIKCCNLLLRSRELLYFQASIFMYFVYSSIQPLAVILQ